MEENEFEYHDYGTEEDYPQKVDLAYLIGTPLDVPKELIDKYFPFLSKTLHLANLKNNDILDLADDLELIRLECLRGYRRYELCEFNLQEFFRVRAYTTASTSLARDGYAIDKLTVSHKHVTYEDGRQKVGGFFGGFFRRG